MINFQSTDPPTIKDINDALSDFGFYHPIETVTRMYAEYINNKKYWYGDNGIDQPDEYWHDISTMNWLKLWVEHVRPVAQLQDKEEKDDVIARLRAGKSLVGRTS